MHKGVFSNDLSKQAWGYGQDMAKHMTNEVGNDKSAEEASKEQIIKME